ncbi:MAG TPA: efflux RND transporter periplasmic adaptor subunit [Thermoanaerobaculia bacterium]|nr:efflux RND transporter periplasmic adaptor subunit [Thermoanaerobaculia bacterium]
MKSMWMVLGPPPRVVHAALALVFATLAVLSAGCAPTNSEAADRPGGQRAEGDAAASETADKAGAAAAAPVAALPLARGRIESVLRYSTNLEADRQVEVYSEAARRAVELLVEEGDRVAEGQVLVRLQDDEQRNSLAKIESQLERARREHARQRKLFEQEMISEQAFLQATYDLEQLELQRNDAERELGYATVRAPIGGVVSERLVNVGDTVQRGQKLFDVVDLGSLVARVFVPERELARLRPGQEARIISAALGDQPRAARIQRIAPIVDAKSGTVKVTVEVPEHRSLVPGMFLEVELVAGVDLDALLVPKRALVHDQDQVFVFRVVDAAGAEPRVERLLLRSSLEDRDFVRVEGEGLAAGDLVVVAGQAGLRPGAAVRLLDPDAVLATLGGPSLGQ